MAGFLLTESLWNDAEASAFAGDELQLRAYTSRLLGKNPALVLHGGGNTSVKLRVKTFLGDEEDVLYVKGSGWDLATIQPAGFAPVRMKGLLRMAEIPNLTDTEMVREQRAAMLDPYAPNPSVEAILHAIIPFKYIDHTHADALVTLTNTPNALENIREVYGNRLFIIPYVMPGFLLARKIYEMTRDLDWSSVEGLILMNHGVFVFANDLRQSYEKMIKLAQEAETFLHNKGALNAIARADTSANLVELSRLRKSVSKTAGRPMIALMNTSPESGGFASLPNVDVTATRGLLTPDHVIRTRMIPAVVKENIDEDVATYVEEYHAYFDRHTNGKLTVLDPAPRWAVWQNVGNVAFGENLKAARIAEDIIRHTVRTIQWAEAFSEWKPLPEKDVFDVEYWELEQAKLKDAASKLAFEGKIALVTGAASGIGKACAEALHAHGAVVVGLDLNPEIENIFKQPALKGIMCDVTNKMQVSNALEQVIQQFGGLDVLVCNAGIFPSSMQIGEMDAEIWQQSLNINLTSQQQLMQICLPYLQYGVDPSVIVIGSKNVPAPGPGASAYSVAKAGLTQLARVAALEFAPLGIRVNTIHPDAVFDTGIWTDEILQKRAESYNMTVEEYKTKNLLKTEITSKDVAALVCVVAGQAFSKTTGAQIPIDGGNDRVI